MGRLGSRSWGGIEFRERALFVLILLVPAYWCTTDHYPGKTLVVLEEADMDRASGSEDRGNDGMPKLSWR